MAVTYIDHAGTQGQTDFTFTFPYLEDEHIKVEIDGVDTTDFTVVATPTAKVVLDTGLSAAAAVRVRRRSAPNENLVDFVNGSVLTEAELDLSYRHNRYLAEEIAELNDQSLQIENGGTEWDAKTKRIKNVGTAVDSTDAVTKSYLDNKVAQVSTGATQPPLKWVFSAISGTNNTYTVTGAEVLGDTAYEVSIDGLIKEPTVEYTVDPNIDTLTIIPNMTGSEDIVVIQRGFGVAIAGTVGTNSLVDGSVTNAKLASDAVTSNKIANDAVTPSKIDSSQAYTVTGLSSEGANIGIKRGDEGPGLRLTYDSATDEVRDLFVDNTGAFKFTNVSGTQGSVGTLASLSSDGDLDITGDYKVNGTNLQTVPTGTVSAFAGSAAPTGYALCDGGAVNTYAKAALHAVVSNTYGGIAYEAGVTDQVGVATTFNLPDLRGRVIAGLDSVDNVLNETTSIDGTVLGEVGGDDVHTLTEAQMPSHQHKTDGTDGGSTHAIRAGQDGQIDGTSTSVSANDATYPTGSETGLAGSGSAHNNVQPTIILNYIIKT